MFESLQARPQDAIMALMEQCKADPNPDKIDLGVGVYKDEAGHTVIMDAVKQAERLWWSEETTKTYVSTVGNADFRRLMIEVILGDGNPLISSGRLASAQAAGGSGALSLGSDLIHAANPDATVWASTPTWANHMPLISSNGIKMDQYPYYNRETLGVDVDDMLGHLRQNAKPGDVVLLHGCCHNPTGADLSHAEWDRLTEFLIEQKLIPFIDLAYFGLGRGLEHDTYGTRKILASVDEALLAASCSKNFALYRERVGLIAVMTNTPERAAIAQTQLGSIQRRMISMPPDHGAALVARILGDLELRQIWSDELDTMRDRIRALRKQLSDAMNVQGGETIARAVENQNGMFSTLPLTKEQAERLRSEYSIYVMNSGRMNIAGANSGNIPRLADALLSVI